MHLSFALFADAALQPAFVPVFTELLGKKAYKEAFRLASDRSQAMKAQIAFS